MMPGYFTGKISPLLRLAICWSFFDEVKSIELLNESRSINPNLPRLNYLLGIEEVAKKNFEEGIAFYEKAISNYPSEDKVHLNEAYNNLGSAYFELGKYREAKEAWEKALVFFPNDLMVNENLHQFIYTNPSVPEDIQEISPFIEKFLR